MYWDYLKYVLRHKWYVFLATVHMGIRECAPLLIWRGIIHDWHKFLPGEFIPYARFFYRKNPRDATGYYKPTDTGDASFDRAWFFHQKRGDHHWQYWVIPEDKEGLKTLEMPKNAIMEMVCDWWGAGRAQGKKGGWDEVLPWYGANGYKMQLDPMTRQIVEFILKKYGGSWVSSTGT
jgi:hypothetical protein